mgnify:CR=1 FL=1
MPADGAQPNANTLTACWSCEGDVDPRAPFCHACGVIQPSRPIDHFVRLGMRRAFDIDLAEVERQYFGFQRHFHPDRFANKSSAERAHSLQHATSLNEAYQTLKSPLARAQYLLEILGKPLLDDNAHTIDDPGLLDEAMEMREALADGDAAALRSLSAEAKAKIDVCCKELSAAFATDDLERAHALTLRLTYLSKIAGEAKNRLRQEAG